MLTRIRIAFLWTLLVLGFVLHGHYHLAELFYGKDIKIPDATGEVPVVAHVFSILLEILPLLIAVAIFYTMKKWYIWTSLIIAGLLALLNLVHLVQTVLHEPGDLRQVVLLSYLVFINTLLLTDLVKAARKGGNWQQAIEERTH